MEILRLKKEVIRENKNKTIDKDVFRDTYKGVDKIELDNSLFTVALGKYIGVNQEEILFSDAIVKVEFELDKDIIDRLITINDARYAFYMSTASDLKKSSCIFIKEEYYGFGEFLKDQSTGFVRYKLSQKDNVTLMKETAYEGFAFSGSMKTNQMPYVVIIGKSEYIYKGLHTVLDNVETAQTIDDIKLVEKEIETTLSAFDGQGIMTKELADRIAKDLNIGHQVNWIMFRLYAGVGGKGVATTVDIHKELLKVNEIYGNTDFLYMEDGELKILDKWKKPHKVKDVDMILNESQCKLIKHFTPEELDNIQNNVDDIFKCLYVCKYNPKKLRNDRTKLNYQFLQALNLSYDELMELTKSDREHLDTSLKDIDSLLITCDLADIQDVDDTEDKKQNDSFSLMLELVKYESSLLKEWSVQRHMQKLLKSRINKVAYGKVFLNDASYRLIIQDVQVYMNYIATRDIETSRNESCLQAGEYYSISRPDKQRTVMGRNPLSSSQELVKFENKKNNYIDSLGYECDSILVMNTYDATASRMSGADFDGDIACCIVDDIIYNSVIELDTPLFFNTFDGAKMDLPYTPDNIRLMTKLCAGNKIGALALANAGVMNMTNEYPYILQDGTLLSNGEFYDKIENDFKLKTSEEISLKMNELIQSGQVIDTMFTHIITAEQKKAFIQDRHKELRKMQYLILYAQQTAIDTSKSGIPVPENIHNILKEFEEKPHFFRYARGERYTTIRNSTIDRYSYECAKHYYTQKFELMQDVCFSVEEEIDKRNKNVFIKMFEKASSGFNQSNVDVIVKDMNEIYSKYKAVKSSLRDCDKSSKFYKNTHKDNNFRAYEYCKGIYNKCKSEIDGYTVLDLLQAICIVKLRSDFILEYFAPAIVDVVKINNNKVRTFYKGEFPEKEDAKIIKIGNKTYTRTFEILDENKLGQSINAGRYKLILKEQEKYGNALQIRFKSETADLRDGDLCIAIRNDDKYSYKLIVNNQVVVHNAYLYKNKKQIIDKEQFCICDVRFNRNLSKNIEYNGNLFY